MKEYHEAIRGIREKTGCSLSEARAKYKQGRVQEPPPSPHQNGDATLTPAKVREIAKINSKRLSAENADLAKKIKANDEEKLDWEGLLAKD
jgi:hypothetical protein